MPSLRSSILVVLVVCLFVTLVAACTTPPAPQTEKWFDAGVQAEKKGDHNEAIKWYRKAAEQGHAQAQFLLGVMYAQGQGVPRNDAEASASLDAVADRNTSRFAPAELQRQFDELRPPDAPERPQDVKVPGDFSELVAGTPAEGTVQTAAPTFDAPEQSEEGGDFRASLAKAADHISAQVTRYADTEEVNRGVREVRAQEELKKLTAIENQHAEAVKWFRKAAEQGHTKAQLRLGLMYAQGQGVAQSDAEAVKWFRKAAEGGHAEAQRTLGLIYSVTQNYTESVKWYRKAAEQEHTEAQRTIDLMYGVDQGMAQNHAEAMTLYRKAAEQGDAKAQTRLGAMYALGQGVAQNYTEAMKWYRKAAEQGYAQAQSLIGVMYAQGQGVGQSPSEAAKWYSKAADQGEARAQFHLGVMYVSGQGVAQNDAEAVRLYRKAANQGHAAAQRTIGLMYSVGEGVPQNNIQAYMWLSLAAAQDDIIALKNQGKAVSIMTPAQLAEAQQMAREWKPKTAQQ